jgi:hypothetical protein
VPVEERYRSSVHVEGIGLINDALRRLDPPRWPEAVFGPVDRALAAKGRILFEQLCRRCHGPFPAPDPVRAFETPLRPPLEPLWEATAVPLEVIGTDPAAAMEVARTTVDLRPSGLTREDVQRSFSPAVQEYRRRLIELEAAAHPRASASATAGTSSADAGAIAEALRERRQRLEAFEEDLGRLDIARVPVATALGVAARLARERYYRDRGFVDAERACLDGFGAIDVPPLAVGYRARPLAGAWAAAPYLHNGSVPTLYQLLSPQIERDVRFFVSPTAFDPGTVGMPTAPSGEGFWFDTRLPGNANVGHEFRAGFAEGEEGPQYGVVGPHLSPEERRALVEYLKVHEDPPADASARDAAPCVVR